VQKWAKTFVVRPKARTFVVDKGQIEVKNGKKQTNAQNFAAKKRGLHC